MDIIVPHMSNLEIIAQQYLETLKGFNEVDRLSQYFSEATQVAAISAAKTAGLGNKKESDQQAVDVMRLHLNTLPISGEIVVGEGEKDKAPMLFIGEKLGTGGVELSIAVDPLEGTDATADLKDRASSVLSASEKGGLLALPNSIFYMDKLVVGPQAKGKVNINASVSENLKAIAKATKRDIADLNIVVLKRSRNENLIREIRNTGSRVRGIEYGDLIPGVLSCIQGSGIHAVMGIGGAPEGVLTAAGVKNIGGEIQAKVWAESEDKQRVFANEGIDTTKVYTERDLAPGKFIIFSATAVTDNGRILRGVRFFKNGARTATLLISAINKNVKLEFKDTTHVVDNSDLHFRFD